MNQTDPRSAFLHFLRCLLDSHTGAVSVTVTGADGKPLATAQLPAAGRVTAPAADAPAPRQLTDCEKDILVLIEEGGRRMTVSEVLHALEEAGKIRGESTVRHALPFLKNVVELLTNRTDAYGKGYGLAKWDCPEDKALTDCEKDIMLLIEEGGQRLTIPQVLAKLNADGKIHGESTTRRALANLHNRLNLLTNRTDTYGKGYGLAEW